MTESTPSIFDALIPQDIIKGWNDRRQSNNQVISGMMPFVQLIGIFNESEYERMFSINEYDEEGKLKETGNFLNRREIYYTGESNAVSLTEDGSADIMESIRTQLQERFINLYIAETREADENAYLSIAKEDGILMAEASPQTIDGTGGIGITDLQVENGINAFKTMTVRLTVNDPKILNNRPEYAKMSTLQGEFLIIYGWSNPSTVAGYDSTPPPIFETDPQEPSKLMLRVPTGSIDSGGYWSAQRMNITGYDFSFNELGQMEISLKLMGKTQMFLATTRLNTISNTWRKLMGTYDYEPGEVGAAEGGFGAIKLTTSDGEVSLSEAAANEQRSYFENLSSVAGVSLADLGSGLNNQSLAQAIDSLNSETQPYTGNAADQNTEELIRRRREQESLGYPYSPGISMTQKVIRNVAVDEAADVNQDGDDNGEAVGPEEETLNTKPITDFKSKLVYYYLGWVMDGVKLSVSDMNRNSLLTGEKKIIPKFAYMGTTPDSNISSAFQTQIRRANGTEINKRIQDAVIRLKEKCMPPFLSRNNDRIPSAIAYELSRAGGEAAGYSSNVSSSINSEQYFPCLGQTLIDGIQTQNKINIAQTLFPAPVGAPVELPHRGHIRVVNFNGNSEQDREAITILGDKNSNLLSVARDTSSYRRGLGVHRFFIPDWYRYYDDNDNPTGGSEEGFDPLNPTDYMAADRGGKFFYLVNYAIKRTARNKSGIDRYQRIIEVDDYRQQSPEIWNLTQRRWYNLYTTYLGSYFENVIRQRIAELQEEGRDVEDIYNEPVDLDFLTSKQYRNDRFRRGSNERFGGNENVTSLPERAEDINMPIDEDLLDAISIAEGQLPSLQQQKIDAEQVQNEIAEEILEKVEQIRALQTVETATAVDGDSAGIEQLTGGRYSREAFNEDGTLKSNINMSIEPLPGTGINALRARSNYGYSGNPTQRDPVGNLIYSGFSNFYRNIRGARNPTSGIYENIIELYNLESVQNPTVTREYILYAFYGKRTDNFKRSDGDEGNEQTNFINNSTAQSILEDIGPERFFEDGLDLNGDGKVDLDDFFQLVDMGDDVGQYQEDRLTKIVEEFQGYVDKKVAKITKLVSELEPLYARYELYNGNIEAADSQIAGINAALSNYNSYLTDDGLNMSFSLYDDTSDFDSVLEVPMGRAEPMRLTTKVAQQWYRMFSGIVQRGAGDVTNYGPAKGGTAYFPPSNVKQFRYDANKVGKAIIGVPKVIFDPIGYERASGIQSVTVDLNKDAPTTTNVDGRSLAFVNWQLFGNPIAPNDPDFPRGNEYGFKSGPRIEQFDDEGNLINIAGGNYVKDYQAFLDLFNVQANPNLSDEYTIIGTWPSSGTDTPYYMIDELNNIIQDGSGSNAGFYEQTGWYLGSGSLPVYLYPSREMATQIDPTKTTAAMPFGTPNGEYGLLSRGSEGEEILGHKDPTDDGKGGGHWADKGKSGERNDLLNQLGREFDQAIDGDPKTTLTKNRQEGWNDDYDALKPGEEGSPLMNVGTPTEPILRNTFPESLLDQIPADIHGGDFTSYGPRIGRGEHCLNLTLDMKRALVIKRKNWYFPPVYDANRAEEYTKVFWSLGDDNPTAHNGYPGSAGAKKIDWKSLTKKTTVRGEEKIFNYWVVKGDEFAGTADMIPVYALAGSTQASIDAYEQDGNNYIQVPIQPFVNATSDAQANLERDRPPRDQFLNDRGEEDRVEANQTEEQVEAAAETEGIQQYISVPALKPRRGTSVQGPRVDKEQGYSNQYYPYGTGVYQPSKKQYGSAAFPEKSPNKNWLYIGDFLDRLPGRGFFTRINNNNNSPSMLLPDGEIVNGEELNIGVVEFIIQNVLAPLPKNRRIGSRSGDSIPRGRIKVVNSRWLGDKDEWRLQDVTYGHLFRPEDDENEGLGNFSPQFADLSTFTIDNVADIPIRRDVIENLMNKQNSNMSIFQFMQQVMRPDSIGVEGSNINVGFRTRSDGVMEVFSAAKNWRNTARQATAEIDEAIFRNRYPEENLLLDYKKDDSLIERLDMSSKFDAGMTLTFELGSRAFAGDPNKFAQFLSFGNVAVELRDFLVAEDPKFEGVIQIGDGSDERTGDNATGYAGRVTFDRNAFFANGTSDKPTVPASLVTSFLMQNPERMAKLNAMLVAESGSNFATQLLSNYMRKTTVTIHGTTNIFPNTTMHIRGVVPQLEGMYIITNVRESVTPSGFQTILEGTLIENRNLDEVGDVN